MRPPEYEAAVSSRRADWTLTVSPHDTGVVLYQPVLQNELKNIKRKGHALWKSVWAIAQEIQGLGGGWKSAAEPATALGSVLIQLRSCSRNARATAAEIQPLRVWPIASAAWSTRSSISGCSSSVIARFAPRMKGCFFSDGDVSSPGACGGSDVGVAGDRLLISRSMQHLTKTKLCPLKV